MERREYVADMRPSTRTRTCTASLLSKASLLSDQHASASACDRGVHFTEASSVKEEAGGDAAAVCMAFQTVTNAATTQQLQIATSSSSSPSPLPSSRSSLLASYLSSSLIYIHTRRTHTLALSINQSHCAAGRRSHCQIKNPSRPQQHTQGETWRRCPCR